MTADDIDEFFVLLDEVYDLMGKTPAAKIISASSKSLFFKALMPFTLDDVRAGLDAHVSDGTFTPVPNDIKAQILRINGTQWLTANEAWGRISKPAPVGKITRKNDWGQDVVVNDYRVAELAPCIMNQQMAEALGAANADLEVGNDTAARMAFIGAYDRLVEREKQAGRMPHYWVSPGGSHEDQAAIREEGIRMGLLPESASFGTLQIEDQHGMKRIGAALKSLKLKEVSKDD